MEHLQSCSTVRFHIKFSNSWKWKSGDACATNRERGATILSNTFYMQHFYLRKIQIHPSFLSIQFYVEWDFINIGDWILFSFYWSNGFQYFVSIKFNRSYLENTVIRSGTVHFFKNILIQFRIKWFSFLSPLRRLISSAI